MLWLETLLSYLVPTLRLHTTPWLDVWKEEERRRILLLTRYVFVILAGVYLLHIRLDEAAGLKPATNFLIYRLCLSATCFAFFALTFVGAYRRSAYTLFPLLSMGILSALLQALSMTWDTQVPFVFCVIIPFAFAVIVPINSLVAMFYLGTIYLLQFRILQNVEFHRPEAYSLELVAIAILLSYKSRQRLEVDRFITHNMQLETQKKLIETQQEFTQQIRAFLPQEIYRRFEYHIRHDRMTVLQAIESVLQPQLKRGVCCLFSDIREFTKKSKQSASYLGDTVLTNIRRSTDIVESCQGIPRLIGDLIFAYFDEHPDLNLLRSLSAAYALLEDNKRHDSDPDRKVNRYALLSIGDAFVGNIGGLDSSREITALGSSINLLSRVDEVTKVPAFRAQVPMNQVVCTAHFRDALMALIPGFQAVPIQLPELRLKIRDFEEESVLWVLPDTPHNRTLITTEKPGEFDTTAFYLDSILKGA